MIKSGKINVNLSKDIEGTAKVRQNPRGWMQWGIKNDYPKQLAYLYYNSPTHRAAIEFAVSAIIGQGVDYSKFDINQEEIVPNFGENWDTFIYKISLDYILYGSFAFQIIMNKDKKTYSFYHVEFGSVRCGKMDEDGCITKYYISTDWQEIAKYPPVEIDAFIMKDKLQYGVPYLFVYHSYSPEQVYYNSPSYISALKAILNEIENIRFDLRYATSNFAANGILTLNRCDTDEEKKELLDNIQNMFIGSDNAGAIMVTFRNDNDDKPVEFTKITSDISNVDLFNESNKRAVERICTAHRIPSKQLLSIPTENASLGGTGNELRVAFNLYNAMCGNQNRRVITETINRMLKMNGIDVNLELIPLFVDFENEQTQTSPAGNSQKDTNQDISEDNISEKVTSVEE